MISDGQVGCSLGNILALVCLCVNNKQRKVCFLSWSKLSSIAITLCVHSSWAQPASPHSVSAVRYSLANLSLHWVWGYWGVLCVLVRLEWGETTVITLRLASPPPPASTHNKCRLVCWQLLLSPSVSCLRSLTPVSCLLSAPAVLFIQERLTNALGTKHGHGSGSGAVFRSQFRSLFCKQTHRQLTVTVVSQES